MIKYEVYQTYQKIYKIYESLKIQFMVVTKINNNICNKIDDDMIYQNTKNTEKK